MRPDIPASDSECFEFYANLCPIIREPGWIVGEMPYGSFRFLYEENLSGGTHMDDLNRLTLILGIVTYPSPWHYSWGVTFCGGRRSGSLDIPIDTPSEEVYRLAREAAIECAKTEQVGPYRQRIKARRKNDE
jgi:hypothetical protein